ncbi:MAG: single-stranded DNA-binding protein [Planctomycetes bacterium]|nr:single-stranded DNA-binding protein [Planctomycetota bacterium]
MFFNQCTLAGTIATEPRYRNAKRKATEPPLLVGEFRLRVVRQQWKREQLTIRVVLFGGAAETLRKYGKKQGDHMLVSGRLCQAKFGGKEGGVIEHHYLVAEDFRFLWGPPGRFVKGHVVLPRAEYERLRSVEELAGGRSADGEVAEVAESPTAKDLEGVASTRWGYEGREARDRVPGWEAD